MPSLSLSDWRKSYLYKLFANDYTSGLCNVIVRFGVASMEQLLPGLPRATFPDNANTSYFLGGGGGVGEWLVCRYASRLNCLQERSQAYASNRFLINRSSLS